MWSRGTATEGEVSDVYVRLGYEFNIACRAFNGIGVETQDLGPVPDLLRAILEETLSQEASQASLDKFLPRIRDIIINLLHGLKKKQQRLRQRTGREAGSVGGSSRQVSVASNASADSGEGRVPPEDAPSRQSSSRSFAQRQGSGDLNNGPDLPPRTTSVQGGRSSPRRDNFSPNSSLHRAREPSRETLESSSSMSSNAMQNMPVIAPYPAEDVMPANPPPAPASTYHDLPVPPPPPPPKQQDALAALQRGGELERRASRRFSAYQIQKHLGTPNGVPMIPPAQNSPIPNRGRGDQQESMRAVRTRSTLLQSRTKSGQRPAESSPLRNEAPRRPERPEEIETQTGSRPEEDVDSPHIKTPEDKLAAYPFPSVESRQEAVSATVNGPISEPALADGDQDATLQRRKSAIPSRYSTRQAPYRSPPQQQKEFVPETSPQPGKELTLFLQYKSKIKKFVLPDGGDLTLGRLQLAFIEKFAWNTHSNGIDLPDIYIQDPVSGVRHELEDLGDIKDRSVLVLNVEALDEVKRHFDDGLGGLRTMIESIQTAVTDQQSALAMVSERQQEAAKEMASLATRAPVPSAAPQAHQRTTSTAKDTNPQLDEVQSLRRDLAVMRQTYTSFVSDVNSSMASIRTKAASVRSAADKARVPSMSASSGRAYVNNGKKNLSADSEKLVTSVDDLQDTVEDLRKDVVSRGVRPLPRQLEQVGKEIQAATKELAKVKEFLKGEKPIWTKIWEKELQVVCDDRDLLTMQEELCIDLEDDLEKAAATFALVEQATKQQNLHNPTGQRSTSRNLNQINPSADPSQARDGVLGEVRALQPNHEDRLEAIERAERARQKELESRRGGEFQQELSGFVEEGKLKKSGGVEETERLRTIKDERIRREVWERQNARQRAAEEREKALPPLPPAEGADAGAPNAEQGEDEANAQAALESDGDAVKVANGHTNAHIDGDAAAHNEGKREEQPPYHLELPTPATNGLPGGFPDASTGPPSPEPEFVEAKEEPPTPAAE